MVPFRYITADDARAAQRAAGEGDARFLAGGTTLIDLMKLHVERPAVVIDISRLPLAQIETLADGGVRVGAMARNSDAAHHDLIRRRYPVLSQALLSGASPQLRNMATTGGNLLQRTRCFYFRDTAMSCNKREPGSGCPAVHGCNRIHAVLGTSEHCIATHPSDMCVALVALDARIHLTGPRSERTVRIVDFYLEPGDRPERETVIEPGELITAVDIPPLAFARRSIYLKVRDRASYAFALASVGLAVTVEDDVITDLRIGLGGVAPKPWRARRAEQLLRGAPVSAAG
ncbi:MAG TPA: xanthine dehydrogenase family protein subunit M, partial [Vicinamibacterales bacterium]